MAATWCNKYVLRHAREIWVGDISEGGMLNALLNTIHVAPTTHGPSSSEKRASEVYLGEIYSVFSIDKLPFQG